MLTLSLSRAAAFAQKVVAELSPFCARIEIAGSIRRRRPECHDVDIVVLVKDPDARSALVERIKRNAWEKVNGDGCLRVETSSGIQIDVFFAHPGIPDLFNPRPPNFGTLWLCRTGSKEHNIALCRRAEELNLHWNPHHGVFDGKGVCLAASTEEDVFKALQLPYVDPQDREVAT